MRNLLILCAFAVSLSAQYKVASAGAPTGLPAPLSALLAQDGVKVLKADGAPLAEIWLAAAEPKGATPQESTTLGSIPHGALLGAIRFPERFKDRRGQTIKPGDYLLRYSFYPINGDHVGVAPQRDFLVLSPIAADANLAATPGFDDLMNLSRKASGTPHPLVLSLWKADAGAKPGIEQQGEEDWVVTMKLGATPVQFILIGVKHE